MRTVKVGQIASSRRASCSFGRRGFALRRDGGAGLQDPRGKVGDFLAQRGHILRRESIRAAIDRSSSRMVGAERLHGALQHGIIGASGLQPVSYTHLDVYKRQSSRRRVLVEPGV